MAADPNRPTRTTTSNIGLRSSSGTSSKRSSAPPPTPQSSIQMAPSAPSYFSGSTFAPGGAVDTRTSSSGGGSSSSGGGGGGGGAPTPPTTPTTTTTTTEDTTATTPTEDTTVVTGSPPPVPAGADGVNAEEVKTPPVVGVTRGVTTGQQDAAIETAESALRGLSRNSDGSINGLSSDPRQRAIQEDYAQGKITRTQASAKLADLAERRGASPGKTALVPSTSTVGSVSSTGQLQSNMLTMLHQTAPTTFDPATLFSLYTQLEAQQMKIEDRRLQRAEDEADRKRVEAENFAREVERQAEVAHSIGIQRIQREGNERFQKDIAHLAANGSFETDENGDDTPETILLKSRLRINESRNFESARSLFDETLANQKTAILNNKQRSIADANDAFFDFEDEIFAQRQQRFTELSSSVLAEQINVQAEARDEKMTIAKEGRTKGGTNDKFIRDLALKVAGTKYATADDIRNIMAAGSEQEALALAAKFLEPGEGSQVSEVQLFNKAVEGGYTGTFPEFLKELERNKLLGKFAPASSDGGGGGDGVRFTDASQFAGTTLDRLARNYAAAETIAEQNQVLKQAEELGLSQASVESAASLIQLNDGTIVDSVSGKKIPLTDKERDGYVAALTMEGSLIPRLEELLGRKKQKKDKKGNLLFDENGEPEMENALETSTLRAIVIGTIPSSFRNDEEIEFYSILSDFNSQLMMARSGAAVTPQEFDRLKEALPNGGITNEQNLLRLSGFLTTLSTGVVNGLVIEGRSLIGHDKYDFRQNKPSAQSQDIDTVTEKQAPPLENIEMEDEDELNDLLSE